MSEYPEVELRRAVVGVRRFVLVKAFATLAFVASLHLWLLHANLASARRFWGRDVLVLGYAVPFQAYASAVVALVSYLTLAGALALLKYRHLSGYRSRLRAAANGAAGVWCLLLVVAVEVPGYAPVAFWNVVFLLCVVTVGCVKRGFDYNLKRLHRPPWTGGNIFSRF